MAFLTLGRACDEVSNAVIVQATKLIDAALQDSMEAFISGTWRSEGGMGDREAEGAFGVNVDGLTARDLGVL